MKLRSASELSRRERQIMDIVYMRGEATVAEVLESMPDPPSNSALRALLRILVEKGHLQHKEDGPRYVYFPTLSHDVAKKSALGHVVETFFNGSPGEAMAALLDTRDASLTNDEYERLTKLIEKVHQREGNHERRDR